MNVPMEDFEELTASKKYVNIALLLRKFKHYDKAETYFLKAIDVYMHRLIIEENENIWVCLIDAYGKLALMFDENRNIDKAKKYYSKAIKIMEERIAENKFEYVSGLVACLSCLGAMIESEDCFKKAYTYAKLLPEDILCKDVIETWSDVF